MLSEYQVAFEKSFASVKKKKLFFYQTQALENIWTSLGLRPLEPYIRFKAKNSHTSFKEYIRKQFLWKQSVINEQGLHSLFLKQDRVNLLINVLNQKIYIEILLDNRFVTKIFPLNDQFELKGLSKDMYIRPVMDYQKKQIHRKTVFSKNKPFFTFDSMDLGQLEEKPLKGGINGKNLNDEWRKCSPFDIPTQTIHDYYGERVALFVHLQAYYNRSLWQLIVFGLPIYATYHFSSLYQILEKYIILIYSLIITTWGSFFYARWIQQQQKLLIIHGFSYQNYGESIRHNCVGKRVRSVLDDQINDVHVNRFNQVKQLVINVTILFIVSFFQIIILIGLFYVVFQIQAIQSEAYLYFFDWSLLLVLLVWLLIIYSLEKMVLVFFNYLTLKENWKSRDSFEFSFAYKIFLFKIINILGPPLMIAFLNQKYLNCLHNNCYLYLEVYLGTMFLIHFIQNFIKISLELIY